MQSLSRIICRTLFIIACCLAVICPSKANALSQDDALGILYDTHTIAGYVGLRGESDYAGNPQNIIAAALFGAYDAKMRYRFEQEQRKEEGKQKLPLSAPLFKTGGYSIAPSQVLIRDEAPAVFKGIPAQYTAFVSREAAEISALRFTGHSIKQHMGPANNEFLGKVILNKNGYFVCIDGLGDLPEEPVLKQFLPKENGFILSGKLEQVMGDGDNADPDKFMLELSPGDVEGTWKRQYTVNPGA